MTTPHPSTLQVPAQDEVAGPAADAGGPGNLDTGTGSGGAAPVAFRYRAPNQLRRNGRYFAEGVFVVFAGLIVWRGGHWLAVVLMLGLAAALEHRAWRYATELDLIGDRVVARSQRRRWAFRVQEIGAVRLRRGPSGGLRGVMWGRLRLADGQHIPVEMSGGFAPFLRQLHEQVDFEDDALIKLEKTERREEKEAERRDRLPWIRPVTIVCLFASLACVVGCVALYRYEQRAVIDRSVPVEGRITSIENEGRDRATVEVTYEFDGAPYQATLSTDLSDASAPGEPMTLAVDPDDPTNAWPPGTKPTTYPSGALAWFLIGAGVLATIMWATLQTIGFAEHPVLERIDPDQID